MNLPSPFQALTDCFRGRVETGLMLGAVFFALLRALVVWLGAISMATASAQTEKDRILVSGLLIVIFTLPALALFILLHLLETSLIRRDGALLAMVIGPALAVLPILVSDLGFVGALLAPAGICWLGTAVLRLLLHVSKSRGSLS